MNQRVARSWLRLGSCMGYWTLPCAVLAVRTWPILHSSVRDTFTARCRVQVLHPDNEPCIALQGALALVELQVGCNPCCDEDAFVAAAAAFHTATPGIHLAWRAGGHENDAVRK